MGTTLTGTTPQDTYDSLIKVTDNGPLGPTTAKYLSDGLGNDSVLALSQAAVGVSETSPLGKLHVKTADTAVSSVSAQGNLLVLEDAENGLSILSSNAGAGYILFGDSADNDVAGIIYDHSANAMIFNTNAAERLRITSTGNVGIGTSVPASYSGYTTLGINGTNGGVVDLMVGGVRKGSIYNTSSGNTLAIDSPTGTKIGFLVNAAERAAVTENGITFNGDTLAINALNDYETGTFTPTFTGSTTNPTVTYATQVGSYTKIGRQVTASIEIGTSANTGGVGTIQVAGLPYTVGVRSYVCVATFNIDNTAATPISIFAEIAAGGTQLLLLQTADNASWANMNWTQATSSVIYVNCTITYFV